MEAFESVEIRHSSFEEVDRILTIVERAQKEYEQVKERYTWSFATSAGLGVLGLVLLIIEISFYRELLTINTISALLLFFSISTVSGFITLKQAASFSRKTKSFKRNTA